MTVRRDRASLLWADCEKTAEAFWEGGKRGLGKPEERFSWPKPIAKPPKKRKKKREG